jgi:glycosyltransferase involved in cell wall biosynthesis
MGSGATAPYVERLSAPLARFLRERPDARLLVVADRAPRLDDVPPGRVEWRQWSPAVEVASVQEMDVGLQPVPDDDWGRGKCALKMLLYMACGVPTVTSPVGVAEALLSGGATGVPAGADGDWLDALQRLREDPDRRAAMGREARTLAERDYSVTTVSERLAEVLRTVAEGH